MRYRLTQTTRQDEEGRIHRVYGIKGEAEKGGGADGSCTEVAIEDLGCDEAAVRAFADACNRCRLSPLHLWDAAQDFLSEH